MYPDTKITSKVIAHTHYFLTKNHKINLFFILLEITQNIRYLYFEYNLIHTQGALAGDLFTKNTHDVTSQSYLACLPGLI